MFMHWTTSAKSGLMSWPMVMLATICQARRTQSVASQRSTRDTKTSLLERDLALRKAAVLLVGLELGAELLDLGAGKQLGVLARHDGRGVASGCEQSDMRETGQRIVGRSSDDQCFRQVRRDGRRCRKRAWRVASLLDKYMRGGADVVSEGIGVLSSL
jgi:hypothetical protein